MKNKRYKLNSFGNTINYHKNIPAVETCILKNTKKNKDIIYGQRSINAQVPNFITRETQDYDIFTKNPKKSAKEMQRKFDNIVGSNQFYDKPAMHPGTHKVMHVGNDMKKGTKDDVGIIDYSKFSKPKPKFVIINGVRYRVLSEEKQAKYKSLRDKEMKFRHKKDAEGLQSINLFRRFFK